MENDVTTEMENRAESDVMTDCVNSATALFTEFTENHVIAMEKDNAAAAKRARKAFGALKKLVTEYRRASVENFSKK